MYAFEYHSARSTDDARRAFEGFADARYLAGGQTLLASLKMRLAQPDALVDLGRIPDLSGIRSFESTHLIVGAMTTHAEVAASDEVRRAIPALTTLAGGIGDPMVRHQGTVGGSLANNDPAADWPSALLALDGAVVTDRRRMGADDFLLGLFTTALEPGELIRSIEFRRPSRAAFMKFKHPASRFALVGVFVADFDGSVRVAVTGAAACAFRCVPLEEALTRSFSPDAVREVHIDDSDFNTDLQATAAYRANLVRVMASRAVSHILR